MMAPAPWHPENPLAAAIAEFLKVWRETREMEAAWLPVLPHQEAMKQSLQRIDALRSGFATDLVTAIERQPRIAAKPSKEP